MQSNKIRVASSNIKLATAQKIVEDMAFRLGLSHKDSIRLQLLAEETLGMACVLTDGFEGQFWIEGEGKTCHICLEVETKMDLSKKEALLAASSSGQNASRQGFMGKIADMIENALLDYDYVNKVQTEYCGPVTSMDYLGVDPGMEMDVVPMWSLHSYKDALNEKKETPEVDRAWDELEKSIVASLSDDVLVGVAGDKATLTILKKF